MTKRILGFGLAGAIGFLVDAGLVMALIGVLGPVGARIVSFSASVCTTWLINRNFTFGDRPKDQTLLREFSLYASAMLVGGVANWGVYLVAIWLLPDAQWRPIAAVAAGSIGGMALNLLSADRLVFRKR